MALYEYLCDSCGTRFDKRMPMSDVLQLVPCTSCSAQARKVLGNFAFVGKSTGLGDGLSWDMDAMAAGGGHDHEFGGGDDDFGDDDF